MPASLTDEYRAKMFVEMSNTASAWAFGTVQRVLQLCLWGLLACLVGGMVVDHYFEGLDERELVRMCVMDVQAETGTFFMEALEACRGAHEEVMSE